jgi:hypothetical protein
MAAEDQAQQRPVVINGDTFPCPHPYRPRRLEYIRALRPGGEPRTFGIAYCSEACAIVLDPRNRQTGELMNPWLMERYVQTLGW